MRLAWLALAGRRRATCLAGRPSFRFGFLNASCQFQRPRRRRKTSFVHNETHKAAHLLAGGRPFTLAGWPSHLNH